MASVLLLDLDNSLADREAAFLAWARAKARHWAPDQPDVVAYLVEQDADGFRARGEFFALVAERFGLQQPVQALVAEYRDELSAALPPVPDEVKAQLRALRADGWKIAVVTNGDADVQAAKIKQLELLPLLDACCISGALGIRKPDPRIFQVAAAQCGHSLTGGWMIGDSEADIVGAHRADVSSIWLHRGRTWPREDLQAAHIADDLVEALSLLNAAP